MSESCGNICRLCINFSEIFVEKCGILLREIIQKYTGIMIEPEDTLPQVVCEECQNKLYTIHEYVLNCTQNQEKLLEMCKIKTENGLSDEDIKDFDDPAMDYDEVENKVHSEPTEEELKPKLNVNGIKKNVTRRQESNINTTFRNKTSGYLILKCELCGKRFRSSVKMLDHTLKIHKQPAAIQCKCGASLQDIKAANSHVAKHIKCDSYKCNQCSRSCSSADALIRHKQRHLNKLKKYVECAMCSKKFKTKQILVRHISIHYSRHEKPIHYCRICNASFTRKVSMYEHTKRIHNGIKLMVCHHCGYSCGTKGQLNQHISQHSDERNFTCGICTKKFKTRSLLAAHLDTHSHTKYTCQTCGKVLNSKRTFRKHQLVHEGSAVHRCTFCGKTFKRRQTLSVHENSHTGEKKLQCPFCPEKFLYASSRSAHKKKKHPSQTSSKTDAGDKTNDSI